MEALRTLVAFLIATKVIPEKFNGIVAINLHKGSPSKDIKVTVTKQI